MGNAEIENEIKILNIDKQDIEEKLIKLKAKKILEALTYIKMFDVSKTFKIDQIPTKYRAIFINVIKLTQNNKSLKEQSIHLRVRKQVDDYEFTLKYKIEDSSESQIKQEVEHNVKINLDEWNNIENELVAAGCIVIAKQEKKRTSYILENKDIRFDIDTWPGMPTYVEIEAESKELIEYGVKILELDSPELSALSGQKLFSKYNIDFYSNLTFESK